MNIEAKQPKVSGELARARPRTAKERGVIAPKYLAHIVLRTGQYRKMVKWYTSLLNAEVTFANDRITFMTYDEEHHRIAIANMPVIGRRSKARAGVDHVAFTYSTLSDLLLTYERLKGLGIVPAWSINHGPTTSLYYEDPDGNFVELQVDNFDTLEDLAAWGATGEFAVNPIGVRFDPDDLLKRMRAGEPEKSLKKRPNIGRQDGSSTPKAYLGGYMYGLIRLAKLLGAKV